MHIFGVSFQPQSGKYQCAAEHRRRQSCRNKTLFAQHMQNANGCINPRPRASALVVPYENFRAPSPARAGSKHVTAGRIRASGAATIILTFSLWFWEKRPDAAPLISKIYDVFLNKPSNCAVSTKNLSVTVTSAFGVDGDSAADRLLTHADAEVHGEATGCRARQKFGQTREGFSSPSPSTFAPTITLCSRWKRSDLLHHDAQHQGIPTKNPDSSACYYVCCHWQNTDDTVP